LLWFAQSIQHNDANWIVQDANIPELVADNASDAVREIISKLTFTGAIQRKHEFDVLRSILKRESLGSTGIGGGIAIPHASHSSVDHPVGATGVSREGIDFNSVDSQPVHVVFLYLLPVDQPEESAKAMQQIARSVRGGG